MHRLNLNAGRHTAIYSAPDGVLCTPIPPFCAHGLPRRHFHYTPRAERAKRLSDHGETVEIGPLPGSDQPAGLRICAMLIRNRRSSHDPRILR